MVVEKRNLFVKTVSIIMTLVMSLSFVLPVIAASSKTVTPTTRGVKVYITTGTGWQYSVGLKTTTVTVKNTGSGRVAVYKNIGSNYMYDGELAPGQSKTYSAKGSGKQYYVMLQKTGRTNTKVKVTANAGSVY